MEKHEADLLRKLLDENGKPTSTDTGITERALARFEARKARAAAWFGLYLLVYLATALTGLHMLGEAETTRTMFLSTIVFLIGFVGTVLIKLWFATANSQLDLLKESKRLELLLREVAAAGAAEGGTAIAAESAPRAEPPTRGSGFWGWLGVSKVRAITWIAVAALIWAWLVWIAPKSFDAYLQDGREDAILASPALEETVLVTEDGSSRVLLRLLYRGTWEPKEPRLPQLSVRVPLMDTTGTAVTWRAKEGPTLPSRIVRTDHGMAHEVTLREAVYPDETIDLRAEATTASVASRAGQELTVSGVLRPAAKALYPLTKLVSVPFPDGAALVSASPEPDVQFVRDGRMINQYNPIQFDAEAQDYRIIVRLP